MPNQCEQTYSNIELELQSPNFDFLSEPFLEKRHENYFQNTTMLRLFLQREQQFAIEPTQNVPSLKPECFDGNTIN